MRASLNQLNERGRQDLVRYALNEVAAAKAQAQSAGAALAAFRNRSGVLDPVKQAQVQMQMVSKLQDQLIATRAELAQVQRYAPDNPRVPVLHNQVGLIQQEINSELGKMTGSNRRSPTARCVTSGWFWKMNSPTNSLRHPWRRLRTTPEVLDVSLTDPVDAGRKSAAPEAPDQARDIKEQISFGHVPRLSTSGPAVTFVVLHSKVCKAHTRAQDVAPHAYPVGAQKAVSHALAMPAGWRDDHDLEAFSRRLGDPLSSIPVGNRLEGLGEIVRGRAEVSTLTEKQRR